jgi:hypothetical protein
MTSNTKADSRIHGNVCAKEDAARTGDGKLLGEGLDLVRQNLMQSNQRCRGMGRARIDTY